MGGHDILRASMVAQEIEFERERQMMIRQHRDARQSSRRPGRSAS